MKRTNNGAKNKLVEALAKGPRTIDELQDETGLSRLQVITNMHYLHRTGVAKRMWCMPQHVSAWIQVCMEAVEEART